MATSCIYFVLMLLVCRVKAEEFSTEQYEDQSADTFPEQSSTEAYLDETTTLQSCVPVERGSIGFHRRSGDSVTVTEDGIVAYVKYVTEYGFRAALTNRTLADGELFAVIVTTTNRFPNFNIGVTTHSPEDVVYPFNFGNLGKGVWIYESEYHTVTVNGKNSRGIRGPTELKSGDVLGVKRKWDGSLIFFYNGKDIGTGAQNVPEDVYGFVELKNKRAWATILVDKEHTNHLPNN